MNPDDRIRLLHISDALANAIRFVEGRGREALDTDTMLGFALMHAIQILGEAANNISQETRGRHPEIPWADIIGMRHRLAHAYIDIDTNVLWKTVTEAAPALLAQVTGILDRD